jgi:hypothetical protein
MGVTLTPRLQPFLLDGALRALAETELADPHTASASDKKDSPSWRLCNVLWGLAKVGFRWDDLSIPLQEAVQRRVVRLRSEMNPIDVRYLLPPTFRRLHSSFFFF